MVKGKPGLPEEYDLKVTSSELVGGGPARLPGYLDRGARIVIPSIEPVAMKPEPVVERQNEIIHLPPKPIEARVEAELEAPRRDPESPTLEVLQKPKRPKAPVNRLQINLSREAQAKVAELVEIIRDQSPEKGVNYNDVIQGLIYSLYKAKDDMDVSQLPLRGRWGSTTAKSFAAALATLFRQALVQHSEKRGDPFKKAVGG